MRVGVDIDGVLYPWDEAARDALTLKFGIERPGPSLSWDYLKENIDPEQWRWLWTAEGQSLAFGQIDRTYLGVVDAINDVLRPGVHEVHFVTHRDPRYTAVYTAQFLRRHFGLHPWDGVHVLRASFPKRRLATWDVFIDDKPDTVFDFLANTSAQVFSPARPWNEAELADVDDPALIRYDDPQDIVAWLSR